MLHGLERKTKVSCYTGLRQYYIYFLRKRKLLFYKGFEEKHVFYEEFCTTFYINNDVRNVCNRKISTLLNKISRNTKYHVTNVYEKKSIMSQSFEEKQKSHVIWA